MVQKGATIVCMARYFQCFNCQTIHPLLDHKQQEQEEKCPTCGGTNVEVISQERFNEGFEVGAFYNIDPRTGKRAKKQRDSSLDDPPPFLRDLLTSQPG